MPSRIQKLLIFVCSTSALMLNAAAGVNETPAGVIAAFTGKDVTGWTGLQRYDIAIGGWAAAGGNYNTQNPANDSNGPVSMTDRDGVNLYQLDLFFEKALVKAGHWDIGGRFDFMFGTDTRYTQATGHWDTSLLSKNSYYNIAMPQAYLEVFAPVGNGLSAKFGHFYSIIGYESVQSGSNFFLPILIASSPHLLPPQVHCLTMPLMSNGA